MKTNGARLLDTLGVAYELLHYDAGDEHLPAEEGLFHVVGVSAGVRGTQIVLAPSDYLRATKGTACAIARPKEP